MKRIIYALMFLSTVAFAASVKIKNKDIDNNAAISYGKLNIAGSIVDSDFSNSSQINYSRLLLTGSIVQADLSAAFSLPYSKLNLAGALKDSDFSNSSQVNYSRLLLTGSIVNADIAAGAAIAYSKLSLVGALLGTDISSSAAIPYSKLAALGNSSTVYTGASGTLSNGNQTGAGSVFVMQDHAGLFKPFLDLATVNSISGAAGVVGTPTFNVPTGGGLAGLYFGASGATLAYNGVDNFAFTNTSSKFFQIVNFATSSVTNPGITLSEPGTGFYRISANDWGWSASTSKVMEMKSTGLLMSQPIYLGNNSVFGLSDPTTDPTSAATKNYVDTRVVTGSTSQNISASDIDWTRGNVFYKTIFGNTTFTFSHKTDGQMIFVKVRSTGSYTIAWPQTLGGESVMWTGSIVPVATTGNHISTYSLVYDGANNEIVGTFLGNY